MEKILKVQMAAELENQGLARAVAAAYASELDPTVEELTEIKTAVSEAFSNAAIHGYPDGSYGNVSMEFGTIKPDTIVIKISDKGVGIEDIARAMEPLFTTDTGEERSGMGFTVMESFMNKVELAKNGSSGLKVVMEKVFEKPIKRVSGE